jgi:hypothetical protein
MIDKTNPIDAAIAAEERDLLRQIEQEPAYFEQIGTLFAGQNAWINWLLMAAQAGLFVAGVWMAFRFFAAADALVALHWGLPAATLLLASLVIKVSIMPVMQANRVLLALKRLELLQAHRID